MITPRALAFAAVTFLMPVSAAAQSLLPDGVFDAPVKADASVTNATATWKSLASSLSSNPLFKALALDAIEFTGGNEFSHSATLKLAGQTVAVQGTLRVDPSAKDGQTLASLQSLTTASDGGRDLSFGALHALSAKLDLAVRVEGGSRKLYARVSPSFTGGPSPPPYLLLGQASGGSIDVTLVGASLKLSDIVPGVDAVPFLGGFVLKGAKKTGTGVSVDGTVSGKAVSVAKDDAKDSFTFTSAGLKLSDLVPAAASLSFLNAFTVDSVEASGGKFTVDGAIAGKDVDVAVDPKAGTFSASGAGLSLGAVLPDAAKLPALAKFTLTAVAYAPGSLTVSGSYNGKAVSIASNLSDKSLVLTGADLALADFVPAAKGVSFLNAYAFDSLSLSTASMSVSGKIAGKAVTVQRGLASATDFTATADALKLGDIVPEAGALKAFDKISLSLVSVTAAQLRVDGALGGKAVTFARTRDAKPQTTVTAAALTLADVFDPLASVPVLSAVAVDKLSLDGSSVEVQAQLNGTTVDVVAHAAEGSDAGYAAVFFKTLGAATFVPAASGHAANDVSLKNALFVVLGADAPAKTVAAADLPGDLPGLVGWGKDETLALKPGVNVAATLDVAASGKFAAALKTAGLDATSLPLRGTLSASTFKAMGGKASGAASALAAADKQELLSGLDLKATVPLPKLPAIAGLVTVKGPVTLALGGNAQDPKGPWGNIPAGLSAFKPADAVDLSLQFGVEIVGAGINDDLVALVSLDKGSSPGLTLLAVQDNAWAKPFGIDGLTLTSGGFKFALEQGTGGSTTEDLAFFASALIGNQKDVAVSAELLRKDGKVALQYFELDGPFGLGDLPGGKGIPNAEKFALDTLKLSPQGLEAKTTLAGKKVDAFLFNAAAAGATPSWTFALDQKDFKITELIPAAKSVKPLAGMTLKDAALVITENGLTLSKASSGIAADLFDDIFGKSAASLKLPGGVALVAAFDPAGMGDIGKGLGKIGVHDDAIVVGEVTGVFGGTPGLRLSFEMEQSGAATGLPKKAMNYKDGVEPSFFLLWGGEDLEAGLKIPMMVKAGKDLLELSSSLELEFSPEGVGIKVVGAMDGTWHKPFGINGISLANLKLDAAINDVGEVQIGFAGDEQFGKCDPSGKGGKDCLDINLAFSTKILLEDALPDGVAFAGTVNELGIPAVLDIAETLLKVPGQLSKLPIPFFTVKNAKLAFATPGATDPDLGLVSEGFAFAGTFNFMGKDLGKISGSGGPTSGVTFKGKISDIDLEVMKFANNDVDIAVNLDPKFIINSDVNVLGGKQRVKLDIEPPHFEFDLTEKLGVFGNAALTVRLDGFDLQKGTFDKNADISVVGEFKSTLEPWLEDEIKKGIEDLRVSANAKLDADSKALRDAQAKVNKINDQIAKIKADDDKAKARAESSLTSVEQRVNSLQGTYDHEIHEAHHCGSRWTHWACSPGWYVAAAGTKVALEAAKGVLEAAKKAVAAAFDLDPRLAGLYAERDIETAGLAVAQGVVKATESVEDWVLKELEKILQAAVKDMPFEVEQAILIGDLKDMIAKNDPLVLDLKFKLVGSQMREYFALKIPDSAANAEFDAVAFALLPALALDKLTEDALGKVSPDVRTWVHSHIASKLAEAQEKVRQQVQAEEAKFKGVLDTFENGSAKYQSAFAEQGQVHAQLVSQTDLTDLMPASLEYVNTYLAVGHSALCVTVAKDGSNVIQAECKDGEAERWSTAKLDDGYVQLKSKGLCLKARDGGAADGNEPLVLASCDSKDKHEQWKIITDDGFYDKIVNRDSQKCLHFNDENANPDSAYAVWTDCLGADSQNFRDLPDAEKPVYKAVNAELKAGNGQCLSVTNAAGSADFKPVPGDTEEKLFARSCDDKNERFNYTEMVNGDVKLVHGDTGACLYPKDSTNVAIRPCDTGEDMLWRLNPQGGKGFQFYSAKFNACLSLPAPPKGSTQQQAAVLSACNKVPGDALLLDFVK